MVDFASDDPPREGGENEEASPARQYSRQNLGAGALNRGQPPLRPIGFVLRRSALLTRPGELQPNSTPEDHDAVQGADNKLAPPGRQVASKVDLADERHSNVELSVTVEADDATATLAVAPPGASADMGPTQPPLLASEPAMAESAGGQKRKDADRQLLLGLDDLERAAALPDDPVFGAIAPGIVALLVGEAGVGKSTIMLAIAVAIAAGVPFAGITPPRPQVVVVYSPEDSITMIGRRINAACIEMHVDVEIVKRNLHVVSDFEPFTLFDQDENGPKLSRAGQRVIEAAKKVGARLIVPEPLIELHMASENDNGQMHAVFSKFRGLARELGCAILIGHHTTKDGGTPRGAGSIIGTVRVTMNAEHLNKSEAEHFTHMGKDKGDLFKLELGKLSYERRNPAPKFFERVDISFGEYSAPALRELPW